MGHLTARQVIIKFIKENVDYMTDLELDYFADYILTKDIDQREEGDLN